MEALEIVGPCSSEIFTVVPDGQVLVWIEQEVH